MPPHDTAHHTTTDDAPDDTDTDTTTDDTAPTDRADALVMFGLTGDLGDKKLLPALIELAADGSLDVPVVGVGRREASVDDLKDRLRRMVRERNPSSGPPIHPAIVDRIDLHYVAGDATEPSTFDELLDIVGDARLPVVYAALPPSLFGDTGRALAESSMPDTTRLVVEKPFGHDEASARELYDDITATVDPERLFIVDHFLAKPAIENVLTVRTRNSLLANSLRQGLVERVEVVFAEDIGVDGRGSFYESVGAVRDVVQNHLLELLALSTMEPPADDSDAAYHAARESLLTSIRPIDPNQAILGQYEGYRDLDDVADDSEVETFAAVRLDIDREPWRDVPVTIVTGKRLADPRNHVTITLADSCMAGSEVPGNRIVFEIKPRRCVSLDLAMLDADTHRPERVRLATERSDRHGLLGDYATMLDNALRGERRHFATIDGVCAAWRIVDPLLADPPPLQTYTPDTDGPDVSALLR